MTRHEDPSVDLAAPRATAALAAVLGIGLLAQGAFAGALVGTQHHQWLTWHKDLGDFLLLVPLASLFVGLALQRHRPEPNAALARRAGLFVLVVAVIATGHAGGAWLAVHVPAAVAAMGLVVRQVTTSTTAYRSRSGSRRVPTRPPIFPEGQR